MELPEVIHWEHRGLRLAYRVWGAERSPTVVLLHGFLDTGASFAPVAQELSKRWRVVVPDHRGHGHSGHVGLGGYYHFPDYMMDLDGLIRQLGIEQVGLVGHSMGASVACYFTGAFPERVWALGLLDGIGPPGSLLHGGAPERVARWIEHWSQ